MLGQHTGCTRVINCKGNCITAMGKGLSKQVQGPVMNQFNAGLQVACHIAIIWHTPDGACCLVQALVQQGAA
jgi:hypothetical protein